MNAHSLTPFTVVLALGSLSAQTVTGNSGSASVHYFSESRTSADGGSSGSTTYALTSTIGDDEVSRSNSPTYFLSGGFVSTIDVKTGGPWITSATPHFVTPRNSNLIWLTGTRLVIGGAPTVTVSGKAATVVAKSNTDVAVRIPPLLVPGWYGVELSNSGGKSSLERGFGVLPIIYTEGAAAPSTPFDLVFKGTKGDQVIWALGFSPSAPVKIGNYLHGFTMASGFFRVLPTILITANSGEFRLSIPPVPFNVPIYVQGLFVTSNPSYSPGSFSNRLNF